MERRSCGWTAGLFSSGDEISWTPCALHWPRRIGYQAQVMRCPPSVRDTICFQHVVSTCDTRRLGGKPDLDTVCRADTPLRAQWIREDHSSSLAVLPESPKCLVRNGMRCHNNASPACIAMHRATVLPAVV